MEEMELICFKIISAVGEAKSDYISALNYAKKGEFEKSAEAMAHGDACYARGHEQHADLISKEAGGEKTELCLLLMHAEDQLMAAETTKWMAAELIELYKK
mgnify:FL=1